jgi:hypothetical protein
MPKFLVGRDIDFFKSIAREVVDDVIQNAIVLYKVNLSDTKVNIYGESLNKTWHQGVSMFALINKDTLTINYEGFGSDKGQTIEFRLDRWMCEEKNAYPETGDVIYFDNSYYQIDNTSEVQYVGGQTENNFSIVCSTFMVRKSDLNIEEKIN